MNAIAQASAAPSTGPKLDNRRVLAALVDLALVGLGAVVILFAADALTGDRSEVRGALSAVILGWTLYYYFALESGGGQTVGKKLLKLRVVRADGRPAGMREIAVRTVLRVVDGVGAYIVGLIVMLVTGQRRQRLGDLAAGTIIVDASGPAVAPAMATAPVPVEQALAGNSSLGGAPVEDALTEHAPVEDAPSDDAPVEDAPSDEAPVEDAPEVRDEPIMQRTISLPSRPAAPATLEDLAEPEPVVEPEPVAEPEPADEPVTVKSVETVSAIDLVMGGAPEEDDSSERTDYPEDAAS
jgi:uncharacterized RDD family membrane protein YckC